MLSRIANAPWVRIRYPDTVNRKKEYETVETEIIFHNETETRVQAQIYAGRVLVSTTQVDPGEIRALPARSMRFDIFFKNSVTGWEIARKLGSDANNFTLSQHKNHYTIIAAKDYDRPDSAANSV